MNKYGALIKSISKNLGGDFHLTRTNDGHCFIFLMTMTTKILKSSNMNSIFILILLIAFYHISDALKLNINHLKISKSSNIVKNIAILASSLTIFNHPINVNAFNPAPLADVGLKEFLVKDGGQHLRLSLPTIDNSGNMKLGSKNTDDLKSAQEAIELIRLRFEQVGYTNPSVWKTSQKDYSDAITSLTKSQITIPTKLNDELNELKEVLGKKDVKGLIDLQDKVAKDIYEIRKSRLPVSKLPFEIPEEYKGLPHLDGRALVKVSLSRDKGFKEADGSRLGRKTSELLLEIDGYHAPLTAGNFIDLVSNKYYDGKLIEEEQELIIQTGKNTKATRKIPLEIFYKKDEAPTWGITSDDDNRATDTPALPFQAYGALGQMRENEDAETGATSEFFFLKWNQALIAPGRNTLDGFYSCFGYVVNNADEIEQLHLGDKIVKMEVISGLENLKK